MVDPKDLVQASWACETCDWHGAFVYDRHQTPEQLLESLRVGHDRLSPDCADPKLSYDTLI